MEIIIAIFSFIIILKLIHQNLIKIKNFLDLKEENAQIQWLEDKFNVLEIQKKNLLHKNEILNFKIKALNERIDQLKINFQQKREDYILEKDMIEKKIITNFEKEANKIAINRFIDKMKKQILKNEVIKNSFVKKMQMKLDNLE